jgi:NTP pyrophosphatase (non-canonical NTP hydrolase)
MSTIHDFQGMCATIMSDIDKKYGIVRDQDFCFAQLIEEVGDLVKEMNKPKLRNTPIDRENLNSQFADVLLLLASLAQLLDVDFEEAVTMKMKILKERHNV